MEMLFRTKTYLAIGTILVFGLLCACASPAIPPTSSPDEPPGPSDEQPTSQAQDGSLSLPDRVDVVYFHRPQRCPTCLCFEERVIYVVNTYFQNELNSGKLTFGVYNIGDSKNTDIVNKYGAVGSQLFINTVKDGTDHITDIQKIWSWSCRSNKEGFESRREKAEGICRAAENRKGSIKGSFSGLRPGAYPFDGSHSR